MAEERRLRWFCDHRAAKLIKIETSNLNGLKLKREREIVQFHLNISVIYKGTGCRKKYNVSFPSIIYSRAEARR